MKTRFALLITMALLAIGLPIPAHADTPFTFTVSGGEATITGYNGTVPTQLVIPGDVTDGEGTYPVTAVGGYAFYNLRLTGLSLPASLTTVGDHAFAYNQFPVLDVPENLTTFGEFAFAGSRLSRLDLPDSVTTIGNDAFRGNQLSELTLPKGLTSISNFAFMNNDLTTVSIPEGLTTIGNGAFSENLLTSVDLPDSLTTIGANAFAGDRMLFPFSPGNQLTAIDLPDGLTSIGDYAFYNNRLTSLTLPDGITRIGTYTFGDNQLTTLTLPNQLTTIGYAAFTRSRLTTLNLPDTLTTVDEHAFSFNKLTSVFVGSAVSSIGSLAFGGQTIAFRFTGTAPQLGESALGAGDSSVRFPWKFDAERAPGGYTTPTWLGYPSSAVADVTFSGGGDIPAQSVDVNGTAVATKPADPVKANRIFTGWFADAATTPFDFSTAITGDVSLTAGFELAPFAPTLTGPAQATATLGAEVTWKPTALTGNPASTVAATGLPDGLEIDSQTGVISGKVTDAALTGDHDVTITATNGIDPAATFDLTISIDYFTYSVTDGTATITGYRGTTPADLVLPAAITDGSGTYAVTAVGNNAFSNKILTSLDLPDGLITIGTRAFLNTYLTDLRLPNTLTVIGDGAFASNRLATLDLPDTLTTIGDWAFNGNQLTTLDLPDTLTTIGEGAFNVNQLTAIDLPENLTTISDWAFADNQLTTLDLPDTLTTIGSVAFYNNRLTSLDLPDTLTTIGSQAFQTNRLTTLDLPDALTTIGSQAFLNNQLAAVRFTGNAPEMGTEAFGTGDPSVRFPWKFGDPRTTDGYTTPTWNGYRTIAVADVTFSGGGNIAAQPVDVDGTSTAVKPADPAKDGHVFTGWFADGATAPFDFTKPITGDVGLTARFAVPEAPGIPGPGTPSPGIPDPAISGLDPAIAGTAREGKTLRTKPGKVTPSNATITYQWRANGKAIKGATKPWLPLRKAQAGKRITVTITAKSAGAPSVTKTSAKTKPVSSAKRRLVLSTYKVGKNKPVTVTATGFKARQKVIIWLGGDNRYAGRADSRGVVTKTVKFAKDTRPGTRRVRVSGYDTDGDRNRTVLTAVRYR